MMELAYTGLCVAVLTGGLSRLLRRLDFASERRRKVVVGVPLALIAWLLVSGALARSGFLAVWNALPPRLLLIPLVSLAAVAQLHRTALLRRLLKAAPRHWAVALQTFRIGVELCFLGLYLAGGAGAGDLRGPQLRRAGRPERAAGGAGDLERLAAAARRRLLERAWPVGPVEHHLHDDQLDAGTAAPELAGLAVHRVRNLAFRVDTGLPGAAGDFTASVFDSAESD